MIRTPETPENRPASQRNAEQQAWSFLPYEQELQAPRRELQVIRFMHSLVIPVVDALTIAIALVAAYYIAETWINHGTFSSILGPNVGTVDYGLLWLGIATVPIWLLVFVFFGVYKREVLRLSISTFDELPQTIGALAVGAWLAASFLLLTSSDEIKIKSIWVFVACAWVILMISLPLVRAITRIGLLSFKNPFQTSALVIGAGPIGKSLVGRLSRHPEYGLRVVGFLDYPPETGEGDGDIQILGSKSEFETVLRKFGISRVLIAFNNAPYEKILEIIHECQEVKVDVSVVPRFFESMSSRVAIEDIEGLPMASLPRYARHGLVMRVAKRLLDLMVAGIGTMLLSPVLLAVCILIKTDSRGPVFFRQERMGKDHKRFMMYKFRSMRTDAEDMRDDLQVQSDATGPIFKMKDDPRITGVGKVIRRLSIDELPQLINVFRGEMSIVGPRPLPVAEAEQCMGTADMRHMVQPGITGLWQILGRSDIPFDEMVQLDYIYVTNWTLRWDIKIILRTFVAIVRKRGAY